jgi:hypothetical protein
LAVWFITLGVLALSRVDCATAANTPVSPSPATPQAPDQPLIEKAFISFRIGTPQWLPDHRYRDLLALLPKKVSGRTPFRRITHAVPPETRQELSVDASRQFWLDGGAMNESEKQFSFARVVVRGG